MALLRQRDFLLLFVGQGVSRLGDGLYTAVVVWLAWTLTHDPTAVALVTTAAYAPAFLATLIGASYADRYDRRRLMIGTDLARAAVVSFAPILLALGELNLTLLTIGVALLAIIGAPFSPARNAIVPQIAPEGRPLEANGLLQVSFRAAFFVGPLLLAPLLAVFSLELVFALDVITFLISAATLAAIRVRPAAQTGEPIGLRADLIAGFGPLRAEPDVLIVITTFVLALVARERVPDSRRRGPRRRQLGREQRRVRVAAGNCRRGRGLRCARGRAPTPQKPRPHRRARVGATRRLPLPARTR